jgi:hypothetical protein
MKALDPLWNLKFGPLGLVTGRCFISVRYCVACLFVVAFPHAASLFLILDNVAKVAAAGERLTSNASDSGSADTVSSRSDRSPLPSQNTTREVRGGSSITSTFQRSDRDGVEVGPEDRQNALLLACYLLVAFGSQILVCSQYDWPIFQRFQNGSNFDTRVITFIIWLEVILALSLAATVTTSLGTCMWRQVRVVFVNRASLWMSATARDRAVPTPNRVLSPDRRPVGPVHPIVAEPALVAPPM